MLCSSMLLGFPTRWGNHMTSQENIMAETFKDKAKEAGHKVAEKASEMGHRISETAEEAADWAKEKAHQAGNRMAEAAHKVQHKVAPGTEGMGSTAGIREHQEVYASCGTKV